MKNKISIIFLILLISSCATTPDESITLRLNIDTVNKKEESIKAKCTLFSTTTKLTIEAPAEILYEASCGPINIFCERGHLKGEVGIFPLEEAEGVDESLLLSTGLGYAFDKIVDAITPLGAILNYTSVFESEDGKACGIPKRIVVTLE
tara:strand:- start:75 stop:521 length:447 start_codon:yes stop_codon:yes gene_type:complete